MVAWPRRAIAALRKLYEPLQDVDVYIEDTNDEPFYSHLLKRVAGDEVRVQRVFACGGREQVIEAARNYDSERPALFLIDGDLDWVLGVDGPLHGSDKVYRFEAYCVENLLICGRAAETLLMQDAVMTDAQAVNALKFEDWLTGISTPLINLFGAFSVARKYAPFHRTVSLGVGRMCADVKGSAVLDVAKVQMYADEAISIAKATLGRDHEVDEQLAAVLNRVRKLESPHRVVSGKDFLLPLLDFHLRRFGCKIKRDSLRVRLVMSCELSKFSGLLAALKNIARRKAPETI